jgi:hypothetical protein
MKICINCKSFLKDCIEYYFNSRAIPQHAELCKGSLSNSVMCLQVFLNNQPKRSKRENSEIPDMIRGMKQLKDYIMRDDISFLCSKDFDDAIELIDKVSQELKRCGALNIVETQ